MATYDAAVGSDFGSYVLRLNVSENTNAGNNTSTVSWSLQLVRTSSGFSYDLDSVNPWSVNIGGYAYSGRTRYDFRNGVTVVNISSGTTGDIGHNADGTASITVSSSFSGRGPLYSGSGSWGFGLTDYARPPAAPGAPTLTRSADGTSLTITSAVPSSAVTINDYQYRTSTNGSTYGAWTDMGSGATNSLTISVTSSQTYWVQTRASSSEGTSGDGTAASSTGFPSAPQSFTATASGLTEGRIDLSWSAPATTNGTITGYSIYRNGSFLANTTGTGTTYANTGLTPGTTYSYYVRARNAAADAVSGAGLASNTVSGVVVPGVPNAPTNLTATPGTSSTDTGKVYLSWTAPTFQNPSITGYDIYRGTTKITTTGTATTYVDTSLTPGTTYTYYVQARNAFADTSGLRSANSNTSSAAAPGVPSAPRSFVAAADGVEEGKINLSWVAPLSTNGTITGYDVFRKLSTDANYPSTPTTIINGATTLSLSYTGLTPGDTYNFRIVARNAFADSSGLRSAEATSSALAPGIPNAPRNLVATGSTTVEGRVTLTWEEPSPFKGTITGYDVYQKLIGDASFPSAPTYITTGTSTTYVVNSLIVGQTYEFKLKARNAYADSSGLRSPDSNTVSILAPGLPSAPVLTAANPSDTAFGQVILTWTKPTNVAGGIVDYYLYADGVLKTSVTGEDTLTGIVTGLNQRQTYSFTVRARNTYAVQNNRTSESSNALDAKAPGAPTPPRNLTINIPSAPAGVADLSWTVPLDTAGTLTGYGIYLSDGALIEDIVGGTTSYRVTGLTPAVQYSFYVRARNSLSDIVGVDSAPSNIVSGTILGAPSAPRNLSVVNTSLVVGRLTITWDAPLIAENLTAYNVFLSDGTLLGSTASRTFVVDNLIGGQSYSFYVTARNTVTDAAGTLGGDQSALASGVPSSTSTQVLPTSITITNDTNSTLSGRYVINSLTSTSVSYLRSGTDVQPTTVATTSGTVVNNTNTTLSGSYTITSTPSDDTLTYNRVGPNLEVATVPSGTVTNDTNILFNGTHDIVDINIDNRTISYPRINADISSRAVPTNPVATVSNTTSTEFNADNVNITAVTEDTVSFPRIAANVEESQATGTIFNNTNREIYNGSFVVSSVPTYNKFRYSTGDDVTKTNLAKNPSMEHVGVGTSILRTNYYNNPRMSSLTTGWTLLAPGATQTPDINGTVIDFSEDVAPQEALFYETTPVPIAVGEWAIASYEITVPNGFVALTFKSTLRSYGAGDSAVQTVFVEPGDTVRFTSAPFLTTTASTGVRHLLGNVDTIPAGARFVIRNAIFEKTNVLGPYFDGETPDWRGWQYEWAGLANASRSVAKAEAVVIRKNEITNPGLETAQSGELLRTNLFTNPSFEAPSVGWLPSASGMTNVRSTTEAYLGGASMECVSTATGSYVESPAVSTSFGASYTASGWIRGTSGKLVSIALLEYNVSDTLLNTSESANITLTGSWQRISVTRNLGNTASYVKVRVIDKTAGNAGSVFYLDATLLEKTAFLEDYFDGETPDADGRQYSWTGAANGSTSTITSSTVYATNLMENPSLEAVASGTDIIRTNLLDNPAPIDSLGADWTVTEAGESGVFSQIYTVDGFTATNTTQPTDNIFELRIGAPSGTSGRPSVVGGLVYTFSVSIMSSILDGRAIGIVWHDSVGEEISRVYSTRYLLQPDVAQRVALTATAPANAITASLIAAGNGLIGPDAKIRTLASVYTTKEALFEQTDQVLSYFSGNDVAAGGWVYEWSGNANESPSVAKALSVTTRTNLMTNPSMEDSSTDSLVATNLITNPSMETSSGTVTIRTNEATNPSYEAVVAGSDVVRTNLVTNPSFEVDTTGWALASSGTRSFSRVTTQNYSGTASAEVICGGDFSLQGIYTITRFDIVAGQTYTASTWVRGVSGRVMRIELGAFDSSGNLIDSRYLGTNVTATGQWQRLVVSGLMPDSAFTADIVIRNVANVSHTFYVDAVMLEVGSQVGPYFDGDTTDALGFNYQWSGTANASASIATATASPVRDNLALNPNMERVTAGSVIARENLILTPNVKSDMFGFAGDGGVGSVSYISANVLGVSSTAARLTITTAAASGRMGVYSNRTNLTVEEGVTYTFSAYARTSAAGKSSQLIVRWYNDSGAQLASTEQTPVAHSQNTWVRRSATITAPTGATNAWVGIWFSSANTIGDTYDLAAILVERTSVLQDYFDGSTTDALGWDYAWSGTTDDSISTAAASSTTVRTNLATNPSFETVTSGTALARQNLLTNPNFETNTTGWLGALGTETLTRDTAIFNTGTASLRVLTPGAALNEGAYYAPVAYAAQLPTGASFVGSVYVRGPVGATLQVTAASTGAGTLNATTTFTATGVWQRIITPTATLGANRNPYILIRTATTIQSRTFHVDNAMIEIGQSTGSYFDGNTADSLGWDYSWSAGTNASISYAKANAAVLFTNLATNPSFETASATAIATTEGSKFIPKSVSVSDADRVQAWQDAAAKNLGEFGTTVQWMVDYSLAPTATTGIYSISTSTPYAITATVVTNEYDVSSPTTTLTAVSGVEGLYTDGA